MTQDFYPCKMEYKKDEHGKEVLLKDGKFQVMMEWEKPYMNACIDALKPFGDVLEVGFGLGYSSDRIQTYRPKSHTIIEYHPEVAKRARAWAKSYPNVTIIEDTWQHALPSLGMFDCIFFDDYPLQSEQELQKIQQESAQSHLLIKKGEQILKEVEAILPFLTEIKYSDEDLQGLVNELSLGQMRQFARFLKELYIRGQISEKQMLEFLNRFLSREEINTLLEPSETKTPSVTNERLFTFLNQCLSSHMRINARFSCFLSSPTSKYQDEKFMNEIITNPNLDFHEEEIWIDVPENCAYFTGNKALVITIAKRV